MSVFRPTAANVPLVIVAYHEARTAWERVAFDPARNQCNGPENHRYVHADMELAHAIEASGGEIVVGNTVYRLNHRGIEISRVWQEESQHIL